MTPLTHGDTGAVSNPAALPLGVPMPLTEAALRFSRHLAVAAADAGLAIVAFATNQTVTGQVTFAHLVGDLARAHAQGLAVTGEETMPDGALRDSVMTLADAHMQFADQVAGAANRWGRSFAHLVFAFPVTQRTD